MPPVAITQLKLTEFRNYQRLAWQPHPRLSVISGPNGSGKTNLLEAISLLLPGRGLRGARTADLPRHGGTGNWGIAARLHTPDGPLDLATGASPASDRRTFRLDGQPPRSQAEIAARLATVWLTPQMDRLFQDGPAARRRFLDRLAWALEPTHAREVAAHDTAMAGRNRLLADGRRDPAWLAGLEDAMARHGVAATAARAALVDRLNTALQTATGGFPATRLALLCPIAERLQASPALVVEDWLRAELAARRGPDAAAGAAQIGAHRADLLLTDAAGLPAGRASTGQQKAMLVGVILGHAALIAASRGFAPLLLLDEPAVHLDAERRDALCAALASLPAQGFVTGTDAAAFAALANTAAFLRAGGGMLHRDPEWPDPPVRDAL